MTPEPTPALFATLESYYDAAPRPTARTEDVGPFTLFLQTSPAGWPYYARPRLDLAVPFTAADVEQVRDRQRELGVPQALEWVAERSPTLLDAARADGMAVAECPLLVLGDIDQAPTGDVSTRVLAADSPDLGVVLGAIGAGFSGTDDFAARDSDSVARLIRSGTLVMVGAYDERGAVIGGGSHSPRGTTTELTGIAVLPRARRHGVGAAITRALVADARSRGIETIFLSAQDDAVARVYERVGFVRVGTACIASES